VNKSVASYTQTKKNALVQLLFPCTCYHTANELRMGERESERVFDVVSESVEHKNKQMKIRFVCNTWVGFVFDNRFKICCNYAQIGKKFVIQVLKQ
jgi:hypothetical protein